MEILFPIRVRLPPLAYLNVSSSLVSILVGAHTDHLAFLNSKFSLNTSEIAQTFEEDTIVTGSLPSADFAASVNSSSNIQFVNDTISNLALNYVGTGALVNSAKTLFYNVTFNLFASYGILTVKNNTAIVNSHFNGYAQYGIFVSPQYAGMVSNIDLMDSTFNLSTKNPKDLQRWNEKIPGKIIQRVAFRLPLCLQQVV